MPSAREVQWTSAPERVRYVPGVIAAVITFLPDQLLEVDAAGRDPTMVVIGREAIAVAERAVMHDRSADSATRARPEVCGAAALEVNDCRHDAPPHDRDPDHVVRVTVRIRTCDDSSRGSALFACVLSSRASRLHSPDGTSGAHHSGLGVRDENGYPKIDNPRSLRSVAEASKECRGCHLWARATQTVFGEGPRSAAVLFVGEQPGDKEDLVGHPFVGPAGRVFDEALAQAAIDRKRVFVTNAVKHFKWRASGKRRLHERPNGAEIAACRIWLELELRLVRPDIVVALGATAAQALLGRSFRVTKDRGKLVSSPLAERVVATVHPSSILRAPDEEARARAYGGFVDDLRVVASALSGS